MGLFSSKPKRNILDLMGLQINPELGSRLIEDSTGDGFIDYVAEIEENFELFDLLIARIWGNEKDLSGKRQMHLTFQNTGKSKSITTSKIKEMVNSIANQYGKDSTGQSKWDRMDDNSISTYWPGRRFCFDDKGNPCGSKERGGDISIQYSPDDGIELCIFSAHKLIGK